MWRGIIGPALVALLIGTAIGPSRAQKTASMEELRQRAAAAELEARRCAHRGEDSGAEAAYLSVLRAVGEIPPPQLDEDLLTLRWKAWVGLGMYSEARTWLRNEAPAGLAADLAPALATLCDEYGSIRLEATEDALADVTLDIESAVLHPGPGTPTGFPYRRIRRQGEEAIQRTLQSRDLMVDPIVLPAGNYQLELSLTRDSALNYSRRRVQVEVEVFADSLVPLSVNLERTSPGWRKIGVLAAACLVPILAVR